MIAEDMITLSMYGVNPAVAISAMIEGQDDIQVRSFYDSGLLRFATLNNVLISPDVDSRIETILNLVNNNDWPSNHPLLDKLDNYRGSLRHLHGLVINSVNS